MRNIKAKYIWISVAISFLLGVGLLVGVTFTQGAWTNVCIVLIAIVFIYMTLAIQMASVKTFRYRPKAKKYPQMRYTMLQEDIDEILKKKGYKQRVEAYGCSYLKVQQPNAYKIVLVRNCEKYFHPIEEQSGTSANKSLEKCQKFIGFEIFYDYNEEALRKLPDFNLQGEKIYYSGLYIENEQVICPNYIEPSNTFIELYTKIKSDLGLEILESQEDISNSI
ncbi:MAG: hypothetical protein HFG91_03900 [Acholeplasmatales bacterium]|jgi:hypothetical protein|nr:hypothetical protein [Acholeplasmatales bacterium]